MKCPIGIVEPWCNGCVYSKEWLCDYPWVGSKRRPFRKRWEKAVLVVLGVLVPFLVILVIAGALGLLVK